MTRLKIGELGDAYRTIEEDTCIYPWAIANGYFRRLVRPRVEEGRDFLWALSRHWMAGMILERFPDSFARLPDSFTNGEAPQYSPCVALWSDGWLDTAF